MKRTRIQIGFLVCLTATLLACKSTGMGEPDTTRIVVNQTHPSVVVLGRRHVGHNATEFDYVSCIGNYLNENATDLNVIPEQQFIDEMYPYFEKSTAPLSVTNLGTMFQAPAVAKKFKDLNLRYLIWIDGKTRTVDSAGGVSCAIGPGGGGCFGFAKWDDEATYEANIWDMDKLALSAVVNTTSSGTSYMPAIIVPIPILADVKDLACGDMALRIRQQIKT